MSRAAVLQAALDLADAGGLPAVTMRSVADRLGVTAMALYPHVGDKDGLLDGLVERLLDDLPLPDPAMDWRSRLTTMAGGVVEVARRHPQAFPLLLSRPAITRGALRVREAVLAALLEAGVPPPDVPRMERHVSTLVLGYAVSEVTGRFGSGRQPASDLPESEYPAHHRLAGYLRRDAYRDDEYHDAVTALIEVVTHAGRS